MKRDISLLLKKPEAPKIVAMRFGVMTRNAGVWSVKIGRMIAVKPSCCKTLMGYKRAIAAQGILL